MQVQGFISRQIQSIQLSCDWQSCDFFCIFIEMVFLLITRCRPSRRDFQMLEVKSCFSIMLRAEFKDLSWRFEALLACNTKCSWIWIPTAFLWCRAIQSAALLKHTHTGHRHTLWGPTYLTHYFLFPVLSSLSFFLSLSFFFFNLFYFFFSICCLFFFFSILPVLSGLTHSFHPFFFPSLHPWWFYDSVSANWYINTLCELQYCRIRRHRCSHDLKRNSC